MTIRECKLIDDELMRAKRVLATLRSRNADRPYWTEIGEALVGLAMAHTHIINAIVDLRNEGK